MKEDLIQWGLVGPGKIAHKFARDLEVAGGARLRAVVSRDVGRAQAFAAQYHAEAAYDAIAELADDPAVDMVYVAVPHNGHYAATKVLLERGKAVLCEKPLTINAAQARELMAIARSKQVLLMEAMWTRFLPLYRWLGDFLTTGRIGRPHVVASAFCIQAPPEPANRFYNPALGGGGLLDLGVYCLTASQLVLGRQPVEIKATGRLAPTGVDEWVAASLGYASGGVAQMVCGVSTAFDNALVIGGSDGYVRVPGCFIHGREATVHADGKRETLTLPFRGEGFPHEIAEAMQCWREGRIESPVLPHADTLATLEVMDEIRRQIGVCYPEEER